MNSSLKDLFFTLKSGEAKKEASIFHLLVYSPDDQNGWKLARLKPGASFFQVFYRSAGTPVLGPSSSPLPGLWHGAGSKAEQLELSTILDAGTAGCGLTHHGTVLAPSKLHVFQSPE